MAQHFDQYLDAKDLLCPMPLLKAKKKLSTMAIGEVLKVVSTDPVSIDDFKAFAKVTSHQLLLVEEEQGCYCFYLKK